jgi:hypothetical protein
MRRLAWVLLFVVAPIGCSCNQDRKKELVPLDQVPEAVMKTANEKLPEVKFERALKEPNGDYELIGKDKRGKTWEIDVSPDGKQSRIE